MCQTTEELRAAILALRAEDPEFFADLIGDVYNISCMCFPDPATGRPMIVPTEDERRSSRPPAPENLVPIH